MSCSREIVAAANRVPVENCNCKNCDHYENSFGGFCGLFNVPTGSREFCSFFDPIGEDGDGDGE